MLSDEFAGDEDKKASEAAANAGPKRRVMYYVSLLRSKKLRIYVSKTSASMTLELI